MTHQFDVEDATAYGVHAAILLANIRFWIAKNEANERHHYEGRTWTYNSHRAFAELFPYLSAKQVRTALKRLVDADELVTGHHSDNAYDRTLWYALGDPVVSGAKTEGASTRPNGQIDATNRADQRDQTGKSSISDSKPDSKPDERAHSREDWIHELIAGTQYRHRVDPADPPALAVYIAATGKRPQPMSGHADLIRVKVGTARQAVRRWAETVAIWCATHDAGHIGKPYNLANVRAMLDNYTESLDKAPLGVLDRHEQTAREHSTHDLLMADLDFLD